MNEINPLELCEKWASELGPDCESTPDAAQKRELLWFIQWLDGQPAGLEKITKQLPALYPGNFGKHVHRKSRVPDWRVVHVDDVPMVMEGFLASLCTHEHTGFSPPQWCPDLFKILPDYMETHALETRKQIAQTEVTKIIFRELDFAISQNVPVPIIGDSRIGKTSPASTWCAMRPGRARLVTVPESNRERDFVTAHADAFGIPYTARTSTQSLRAQVQEVHRLSGLFVVYDEAQFLIPSNYTKSTPPIRLNFVRCQVIDRNLGCAFFATPQSYKQTLEEFVKKTGYRMEQWLGRLAPAVLLPADLGKQDLIAVAKLHFPEMPEPFLKLISGRSLASEGYLKNMEITAKRARFLAEERGSKKVSLEDVEAAIEQMMPGTIAPQPGRANPAAPTRTACTPFSDPSRPSGRRASFDTLSGQFDRTNRAPKREDELSEATA